MSQIAQRYDWDKLNAQATLNRQEAAFYVRLSQRAFDKRIGTVFPCVKLGRRIVFLRASLLAALAKLERKAITK